MRGVRPGRKVVPILLSSSPDVTCREGKGPPFQYLFSTTSPTCVLCMPDSHLMAPNPPPPLQHPARTVGTPFRHPCQRAVVWMTWTSWGRPCYSSHCPRSPSKCGGEGTPWLAWGEPSLSHNQTRQGEAQCQCVPVSSGCRVPPCAKHCTGCKGGAGTDPQGMEFMRERGPVPHSGAPAPEKDGGQQ